jgi:hypothetical protein
MTLPTCEKNSQKQKLRTEWCSKQYHQLEKKRQRKSKQIEQKQKANMIVKMTIKRNEQNNVFGQNLLLKNRLDEKSNLCIWIFNAST